jgi:3-deoxy-D-manno-octulosonic-acid transferase
VIIVYNLIMAVAIFLLWPIWVPLVWTRKKHRDTFFKRLFMQALSPSGPESPGARRPIWIHALSVGEVLSAEPLVNALAQKHGPHALVFTASTQTGFEMATRLIAPHVSAVRYFPYDTLFSVNRALHVIQPRQVVIVETDIWPNFLYRLKKCRIPVHLVNARLSDRSFRGYRRVGWLMAPLLSVFGRICVQTDSDRQRFRTLGVPDENVATVGNIKFDQPPATLSTAEIKQLREQFKLPADVPIWVAGSTHEGEEDVLSVAYRAVYASGIHPALIVAPRDPGRADSVCTLFKRSGCNANPGASRKTARAAKRGGDRPHRNTSQAVCAGRRGLCGRKSGESGWPQPVGACFLGQAGSYRAPHRRLSLDLPNPRSGRRRHPCP